MSIRTALPIATLMGAVLGLVPGAAPTEASYDERRGRADVAITIKLSDDERKLLGKVTSSRNSCMVMRRVKVFWLEEGYDDYLFVAGDKTDLDGKWKIKHPERIKIPDGKYFARVGRTDGCQAAKSRVVTVD